MDNVKTKRLADEFEQVVRKYEGDPEAVRLHNALTGLLDSVKNGSISLPVERVPGERLFQEGGLSRFADSEEAYSRLKFVLAACNGLCRYQAVAGQACRRALAHLEEIFGGKFWNYRSP